MKRSGRKRHLLVKAGKARLRPFGVRRRGHTA
jgi:hypothetical protein